MSLPDDAPARKRFDGVRFLTIFSCAVLMGSQFFVTAHALAWAISGLFKLGTPVFYVLDGLFLVLSAYALYLFVKGALMVEPVIRPLD